MADSWNIISIKIRMTYTENLIPILFMAYGKNYIPELLPFLVRETDFALGNVKMYS